MPIIDRMLLIGPTGKEELIDARAASRLLANGTHTSELPWRGEIYRVRPIDMKRRRGPGTMKKFRRKGYTP